MTKSVRADKFWDKRSPQEYRGTQLRLLKRSRHLCTNPCLTARHDGKGKTDDVNPFFQQSVGHLGRLAQPGSEIGAQRK